jgi:Protein of unknown function, DUF481
MTLHLPNLDRRSFPILGFAILLSCGTPAGVPAQNVVLRLKSGDQITGFIVSENTNQVVISNAWVKALPIPLAEISKREAQQIANPPLPAPSVAGQTTSVSTNAISSAKPATPPKGKWNGEARIGTDLIYGTKNQQDYAGHLGLTYLLPYQSDPKKFFRDDIIADAEYQETEGIESANHAMGSNKTAFDIGKRLYAYNFAGLGYDDVRKIDFQYEIGLGVGDHLVTTTNFVLNIETGLNYTAQYRKDTGNLETFYLRLAENLTWKILEKLTLTENLGFFPQATDPGEYHARFESNLGYAFWKSLSLNLTAIDLYDTQAAPGVDRNEFELRSSLGVKF